MKSKIFVFVKDVKTIREDVNRKLEELKVDVSKELNELNSNYSIIKSNVDTIAAAVRTIFERYQSLTPKFNAKAKEDAQNFDKMGVLLGEMKELVSKPALTSFLTPEFLTQKLHSLDQAI